MKKVAIAVTNDLCTDQRVHKVAITLMRQGWRVTLIGRKLPWSKPVDREYLVVRFNLIFKKGPWFYAEFNFRLWLHLLFSKYSLFLSNDLDTLPACWLASSIKRRQILFDSHELFTEMPELIHRKFQRNVWLWLEKKLLPKVWKAYTVSPPIAEELSRRYGIRFEVIRNVPFRNKINTHSNMLDFPGKKLIIYQGVLNIGRGLEMMIDALAFIENTILILMGDGDIAEELKLRVTQKGLNSKVVFTGRIPFEKLMEYTQNGHLGISLEEDLGDNYRFALPNKLFDYIQAGLPVIVSDLPQMSKLVQDYKVGEVLKNRSVESLVTLVESILSDQDKWQLYHTNALNAAIELCWENEQSKLVELIKEF